MPAICGRQAKAEVRPIIPTPPFLPDSPYLRALPSAGFSGALKRNRALLLTGPIFVGGLMTLNLTLLGRRAKADNPARHVAESVAATVSGERIMTAELEATVRARMEPLQRQIEQ